MILIDLLWQRVVLEQMWVRSRWFSPPFSPLFEVSSVQWQCSYQLEGQEIGGLLISALGANHEEVTAVSSWQEKWYLWSMSDHLWCALPEMWCFSLTPCCFHGLLVASVAYAFSWSYPFCSVDIQCQDVFSTPGKELVNFLSVWGVVIIADEPHYCVHMVKEQFKQVSKGPSLILQILKRAFSLIICPEHLQKSEVKVKERWWISVLQVGPRENGVRRGTVCVHTVLVVLMLELWVLCLFSFQQNQQSITSFTNRVQIHHN